MVSVLLGKKLYIFPISHEFSPLIVVQIPDLGQSHFHREKIATEFEIRLALEVVRCDHL